MDARTEPGEIHDKQLTRVRELGLRRQWQQALVLLDELRESGVQIDGVTSTATMLSSYALGGLWEEALKLFHEMRQSSPPIDIVSCTATLNACAARRQGQAALEVYRSMLQGGRVGVAAGVLRIVNVETIAVVIDACQNAGQWQEALHLYDVMQRQGQNSLAAARAVLRACDDGHQPEKAKAILQDL
eukprot:s3248_g1.t2